MHASKVVRDIHEFPTQQQNICFYRSMFLLICFFHCFIKVETSTFFIHRYNHHWFSVQYFSTKNEKLILNKIESLNLFKVFRVFYHYSKSEKTLTSCQTQDRPYLDRYRHSSIFAVWISAILISAIFNLTWFIILSNFPPLQYY